MENFILEICKGLEIHYLINQQTSPGSFTYLIETHSPLPRHETPKRNIYLDITYREETLYKNTCCTLRGQI